MKNYGRVDVYTHIFLTPALVGGEWLASCPAVLSPEKESPVAIE
jgi:hypothetical protein